MECTGTGHHSSYVLAEALGKVFRMTAVLGSFLKGSSLSFKGTVALVCAEVSMCLPGRIRFSPLVSSPHPMLLNEVSIPATLSLKVSSTSKGEWTRGKAWIIYQKLLLSEQLNLLCTQTMEETTKGVSAIPDRKPSTDIQC